MPLRLASYIAMSELRNNSIRKKPSLLQVTAFNNGGEQVRQAEFQYRPLSYFYLLYFNHLKKPLFQQGPAEYSQF